MTKPIKILLIEDDMGERTQLSRALDSSRYDLAIVERRLAWSSGLHVGSLLRQRYPNCPLLMPAQNNRPESVVEAIKAGFDDFLLKTPGHLRRLPATVGSLLEEIRARRREDRAEERVQDLLGRLNVGIYRATSRGVMLYANTAFCRIFGLASWRESPTWSLRALLADSADEARLSRELRRTGMVQAAELRLKRQGGKDMWISLTQCLRSGTDTLGVIEGLVEDITERKRLAAATRRSEEEEQQVRAMETVGRLAGGVAHDFNNLLTAINGYSELLLGALPRVHDYRESVSEIRRAGSRAARLTR